MYSVIYKRLISVFLLISAGALAFLYFFFLSYSNSLKEEKRAQSKYISEVGIGIIGSFYTLASRGEVSVEDAQTLAMNALESATFGENGYYWINSGDGVLLMQPYTPERVGINQIDWVDSNGAQVFRDFIGKAKNGGGWVSYSWPKPNSELEYPKISYISYFKPWDWALGTGIYLDDMLENIHRIILKASGALLLSFISFVVLVLLLVNYFVRQLEDVAIRDPLTNLYTKRFLGEILPTIINRRQRDKDNLLAIIFLDIDHFKSINDRFGHKCGDEVLAKVAKVMVDNVRSNDYCVRFGGEEFVIVGFFENEEAAFNCAERVRRKTSRLKFKHNHIAFEITISAGVAINDEGESFQEALTRADEKLYQAKHSGRNTVAV